MNISKTLQPPSGFSVELVHCYHERESPMLFPGIRGSDGIQMNISRTV